MRLSTLFSLLLLIGFASTSQAQSDEDAFKIKEIYQTALTKGQCNVWLDYLTNEIGGRLSGTPEAAAAVEYVYQVLDSMGMDKVYRQECMVPHWERGEKEICRVVNSQTMGTVDLTVLALGNSTGSGPNGVTAEVIEVQTLDELKKLGRKVKGKIVFFNRPMDPTQINTFAAYSGAVDQRVYGPNNAAELGAVGAIVRSMTLRNDDVPHTGVTVTKEGVKGIPAVAVSTMDADLLHRLLTQEDKIRLHIRTTSRMLKPKLSHNVIGEIKGSEFPNEIILVGGHLDSWDVGTGAHDDGAGCVHSMDVIHILNQIGYKPKRTIRCVLFMNEENGQEGAKAYMEASNKAGEYHMAAIESDKGGFTPRGFTVDAHDEVLISKLKQLKKWAPLLKPYGLNIEKGGSGADISRLKSQKGILFGFKPDSQRYFDYHHAPSDATDVVNPRELQLGAAAMTALVYLLDKYGIE